MAMKHHNLLMASVVACALSWATGADATMISHNGTPGSAPVAGSGEVDVDLNCLGNVCQKNFREIATHELLFQVAHTGGDFAGSLTEAVVNLTGTAWTDFHFEFDLGDGFFEFILGVNAEIDESMPDMLWVFFDEPLESGESFTVEFDFFPSIDTGGFVQIAQHPSVPVPEPATLGLLAAGLGGLVALRRRKEKRGG